MTARKPNWRTLAPNFMCGHSRSAENTNTGGCCRACHRLRERRRHQRTASLRRQADRAKVRQARSTWGDYVLDESVCCMDVIDRPRKPRIPLSPRTLALIASCRAEYELALGQFDLFTVELT